MVENYCPRGEIQPFCLIFTEARAWRKADVNSRQRLNFTRGNFLPFPELKSSQSIFVLYTPFIDFLVHNEP